MYFFLLNSVRFWLKKQKLRNEPIFEDRFKLIKIYDFGYELTSVEGFLLISRCPKKTIRCFETADR